MLPVLHENSKLSETNDTIAHKHLKDMDVSLKTINESLSGLVSVTEDMSGWLKNLFQLQDTEFNQDMLTRGLDIEAAREAGADQPESKGKVERAKEFVADNASGLLVLAGLLMAIVALRKEIAEWNPLKDVGESIGSAVHEFEQSLKSFWKHATGEYQNPENDPLSQSFGNKHELDDSPEAQTERKVKMVELKKKVENSEAISKKYGGLKGLAKQSYESDKAELLDTTNQYTYIEEIRLGAESEKEKKSLAANDKPIKAEKVEKLTAELKKLHPDRDWDKSIPAAVEKRSAAGNVNRKKIAALDKKLKANVTISPEKMMSLKEFKYKLQSGDQTVLSNAKKNAAGIGVGENFFKAFVTNAVPENIVGSVDVGKTPSGEAGPSVNTASKALSNSAKNIVVSSPSASIDASSTVNQSSNQQINLPASPGATRSHESTEIQIGRPNHW